MSDYVTEQTFSDFLKEEKEHHKRAENAGIEHGKQIADVSHKLDSLYRWRQVVDVQLDKHDHTLFGNGEAGWDEILRRVVKFIDKEEAKDEARWSDAKKFGIGILAFLVNTGLAIWLAKIFG